MQTMRNIILMHTAKAVKKTAERPDPKLGVSNDERQSSVPLLIFTEQHLKAVKPEVLPTSKLPYEKVQIKGAGNSLALSDFETQAFTVGNPFGGV